jgi:RNA polymerase sigma factor (sigma-70 family)
MASQPLMRSQLDVALDLAASEPESFETATHALISHLGTRNLELTDPMGWKKPGVSRKGVHPVSFLSQFQADVARIAPLKRQAEARLARAIEFARLRLDVTLQTCDVSADQLEAGLAHPGRGWCLETAQTVVEQSNLPPMVARRWVELHGLRTEMVERSLFLVPLNVERYARTGASRIDLIQEGCIALYRAVDGFDWRRGLLFRTYAAHWLAQAFRDYLYNFSNVIRVPIYVQKAMHRAALEREDQTEAPGTAVEAAEESGLSERAAHAALGILRGSLSLEMEGRAGVTLGEMLEDPRTSMGQSELAAHELERQIEHAFQSLTARERVVIGCRFGLGQQRESTLAEVAEELKLSIERVRQIQVSALAKLAAPALRRQFEVFLN